MVSVSLITWNEEEMLPGFFDNVLSIPGIKEICIVDSESTDRTIDIIEHYAATNPQIHIVYKTNKFEDFASQRNMCLEMCTQPWTLILDADERITPAFQYLCDRLDTQEFSHIHFVSFFLLTLVINNNFIHDADHCEKKLRMWRTQEVEYRGRIHEYPYFKATDTLMYDGGPIEIPQNFCCYRYPRTEFYRIAIEHHQNLKTDEALIAKGERWEQLNVFEESEVDHNIKLSKTFWVDRKHKQTKDKKRIKPIPKGARIYND